MSEANPSFDYVRVCPHANVFMGFCCKLPRLYFDHSPSEAQSGPTMIIYRIRCPAVFLLWCTLSLLFNSWKMSAERREFRTSQVNWMLTDLRCDFFTTVTRLHVTIYLILANCWNRQVQRIYATSANLYPVCCRWFNIHRFVAKRYIANLQGDWKELPGIIWFVWTRAWTKRWNVHLWNGQKSSKWIF